MNKISKKFIPSISCKSLFPLFIFGISCTLYSSELQTKRLLEDSIKFSLQRTFISVIEYQENDPNPTKVRASKGTVRFDFLSGNKKRPFTRVVIAPPEVEELCWMSDSNGIPLKDTALRVKYPTDWSWFAVIYAMGIKQRFDAGTYSLSYGSYMKIPCYKITVKYPIDDENIMTAPPRHFLLNTISKYFQEDSSFKEHGLSKNEYLENKSILTASYFAVIELLVDKSPGRPFIYEYKAFNPSGVLIDSRNWGKIKFIQSLEPKIFEFPNDVKIKEIETKRQYANDFMKSYGTDIKSPPSKISKIINNTKNVLDRNTGSILDWGSHIALIVAIGTVIAIIIIKIKAKRKIK